MACLFLLHVLESKARQFDMAGKLLSFSLLLSFALSAVGSRSDMALGLESSDECVYTLYIKTGWIWKGGTDSVIGVTLAGKDGKWFTVPDLVKWGGLMGKGHDYYERSNLDIFSGRGPCLPSPPCLMNLTSDGTGAHHGWYCKSVEVTTTGPHMGCAKAEFGVDQWLATDAPPYKLYATRSVCPKRVAAAEEQGDRDDAAE